MKLDIGAVLRRLRVEERHLTLYEVSEAVGGAINPTTISRMESKNQTITPEYLQILAEFFGVRVSDIIREAEGGAPADPALIDARRVPLLDWADIGAWLEPQYRAKLRETRETLVILPPVSESTFALRQVGDSMQSDSGESFAGGMTLLVEPGREPRDRDYVIALPAAGGPVFRQLVIEGADTYLKPLNRNYRPQLMEPDTRIIGTVGRAFWRQN